MHKSLEKKFLIQKVMQRKTGAVILLTIFSGRSFPSKLALKMQIQKPVAMGLLSSGLVECKQQNVHKNKTIPEKKLPVCSKFFKAAWLLLEPKTLTKKFSYQPLLAQKILRCIYDKAEISGAR